MWLFTELLHRRSITAAMKRGIRMVRSSGLRMFIACMVLSHAGIDSWAMLSELSTLSIPGIAKDVAINEPAPDAYVKKGIVFVSTDSGIAAVDASNPASPVLKYFLRLPGKGNELSVSGDFAFVTDGTTKGAQIVDVSNPESLHSVGSMGDSCGYVWGIDSRKHDNSGTSIVGIASLSGLTLFQSDNSGQTAFLSRYSPYRWIKSPADSLTACTDDTCWGYKLWIKTDDIVIDSNFAYLLYFDSDRDGTPQHLSLKKVNLSDPLHPLCVDSLALHSYGCGLTVLNGQAYVVHTSNLDLIPGMDIIDVKSIPMTMKSSINFPGPAEDIAVEENRAYIACGGAGIRVLNVSNPASPIVVDSFPLIQFSFPVTTYGIALGDTTIYCAMGERGLWIFRKSTSPVRTHPSLQKTDDSHFSVTVNKTVVRIKFPHLFTSNVSVGLYALNGKLLFQKSIASARNQEVIINAGDRMNNSLKPGAYLLYVKKSDGAQVFKKSLVIVK